MSTMVDICRRKSLVGSPETFLQIVVALPNMLGYSATKMKANNNQTGAQQASTNIVLDVIRDMPNASEAEIDREIERRYDAMEFPECHD
jgi:hypothetical protein